MERDRQDEPSQIEQVPPASLEPAQGSGEATQVPASTERTVYEGVKLEEAPTRVTPEVELYRRIEELEQQVQEFRERVQKLGEFEERLRRLEALKQQEAQQAEVLEQQRLRELEAKKQRLREQNREAARRYRERNRDEVRERNAAWVRAKRAREHEQTT